MPLSRRHIMLLAFVHFIMRFMDKIYEGEDKWGDAPWLDIQ